MSSGNFAWCVVSQHSCPCRFLFMIQYFVGNGFYVILDNQIGQYTEDQTIMSNPALLAQNWVNLYTVSQCFDSYFLLPANWTSGTSLTGSHAQLPSTESITPSGISCCIHS